jgi:hypothetical protein
VLLRGRPASTGLEATLLLSANEQKFLLSAQLLLLLPVMLPKPCLCCLRLCRHWPKQPIDLEGDHVSLSSSSAAGRVVCTRHLTIVLGNTDKNAQFRQEMHIWTETVIAYHLQHGGI